MSRWLTVLLFGCATPLAGAQAQLWKVSGGNALDACELADYDGDGHDDILWSQWSGNVVHFASGRDGSDLLLFRFGTSAVQMGTVLVPAPDVDADGVVDFLATDPTYATFSAPDSGLIECWSVAGRTVLYRATGDWHSTTKYESALGVAAATIGDADRDGRGDFAYGVGTVHDRSATFSRVYLRYATKAVRALDLPGLFHRDRGRQLVAAGDVDGDGAADFAVGYGKSDSFGYVEWYSGDDRLLIRSLQGEAAADLFGYALENAGDLDGDGVDDLLVGAPDGDDLGAQTGRMYAYSGASGAQLARLVGGAAGQRFGAALARVADVDGDGATDFAVGAPGNASNPGRFHVGSGATLQLLYEVVDPSGSAGYGAILAGVGDLDANGVDDLVVSGAGPVEAWSIGLLPTVASVDPWRVNYRSSTTLRVRGTGFSLAPPIGVTLAGVALTNVTVLSDTELTCDAPPLDPGFHPIVVTNGHGSGTLAPGIAYTPTIAATGALEPGGFVDLTFWFDRFDTSLVIVGVPPAVSVPTPPFDGTLQILPFNVLFTLPTWPSDRFVVHVDLPDDPALSGLTALVQSLTGPRLVGRSKDGAWSDAAELVFP